MNILVIEDEQLVAVSLMQMIRQLEPDARLDGPLASVSETRQWLKEHPKPDLIFSDIQLSDGIALDIFSEDAVDSPVIFTTAYNEYAIRAFKLNSIDYLLKPVERSELEAALKKFHLLQSKFSNQDYLSQMKDLFLNFSQAKKYKERFAVHLGRSVMLVPVEETAYFCREELIYLVNREGKKLITDFRSLDEIQELVDPSFFFRVNRQHLVHLPFIESYRSDDTGKLTLKLKNLRTEELIVSKEKAAEFRRWFE